MAKPISLMVELEALVAKAQAGDKQAIIALLSGVVLLMTFIYIFSSFLSAGGKKKKKGASGSVMKVEDGKEVRRSTRTPKAPKRWVPDSPAADGSTAPETPTTAGRPKRQPKTPTANGVAKTPTATPSRSLRSRTRA